MRDTVLNLQGDAVEYAWGGFFISVLLLIAFDITVLENMTHGKLTARNATLHVFFWLAVGFVFNLVVYSSFGSVAAVDWFEGYFLEYILSFDNLFVFHVVFRAFATPSNQEHRALYFGIAGAILLRLFFFLVGTEVFHLMYAVRFLFGCMLVYTGVKAGMVEDDNDEDVSKNPLISWASKHVPLTRSYDSKGSFLVFVPDGEESDHEDSGDSSQRGVPSQATRLPAIRDHMQVNLARCFCGRASPDEASVDYSSSSPEAALSAGMMHRVTSTVSSSPTSYSGGRVKGTLLLMVVIAIELADIIFAVDSAAAKISAVDSMFLNFSSSVYAMFTLRSLYFIVAIMVKAFRLLKYGVAVILVFIGARLILGNWMSMPQWQVCLIMVAIFLLSVGASMFANKYYPLPGGSADGSMESTPLPSQRIPKGDTVAYTALEMVPQQHRRVDVSG